MKKIILLLISLSFLSCSLEDENSNENYHIEILPVESVIMPDYFTYGETHEITISYIRPTSCYAFNDIYYLKENNTRTVAVITSVYDNQTNCSEIQQEVNTTFTVEAIQEDNYIFNFWQGEDSNGNDMYLTIEVPVEQ